MDSMPDSMENGYAERPTGRINSGSLNSVPEFYGRRSESAECWLKTLGRLASPSVYHWDENTMLEVAMLKMRDEAAIWLNSLNPNLCWREFERLFLVRFVEPIKEAMSRLTHCKQGHKEGIQSYTDRFKSDARAAGRTEDLALLHQYLDNMSQDLKIEVYRKGMDTLRTIDCVAGFLRSWEIVSMADNYNQYPQSRPVRPPMGYDSNRGRVNDNVVTMGPNTLVITMVANKTASARYHLVVVTSMVIAAGTPILVTSTLQGPAMVATGTLVLLLIPVGTAPMLWPLKATSRHLLLPQLEPPRPQVSVERV